MIFCNLPCLLRLWSEAESVANLLAKTQICTPKNRIWLRFYSIFFSKNLAGGNSYSGQMFVSTSDLYAPKNWFDFMCPRGNIFCSFYGIPLILNRPVCPKEKSGHFCKRKHAPQVHSAPLISSQPPQLSSPLLSPRSWSTRSRIQLADLSSSFGHMVLFWNPFPRSDAIQYT